MSWYDSRASVNRDAVDETLEGMVAHLPNDNQEETAEQVAAAKVAAKSIIASGALGEGPFSISISGHANAGHEVQEWSADSVTVAISLVSLSNQRAMDEQAAKAAAAAAETSETETVLS